MSGYTDTIRKWAADSRHVGLLNDPDGTGEVGLEAGEAGRRLAVRFTLQRRGDLVGTVRFQVFGCGFTIAACAAAAELAEGKELGVVRKIDAGQIDRALDGLPAERDYCADLAAKALQAAVSSAEQEGEVVAAGHHDGEHGPRITADNPVYRLLMDSVSPSGVREDDRRLFAGVIALAVAEPCFLARAVGLDMASLEALLGHFFPHLHLKVLLAMSAHAAELAPEINDDVRQILHAHVPEEADGRRDRIATWLADILAARAAQPGHLWVAMGLFERPELTAAIRRHLPSLAAANSENMRWKRYLFRQACELNGGVMCKSPNCGDCSDYALCFET